MADVILTEPDALDRHGDVWRELWSRTRPLPPMLELEWVRQWWRLHAGEGELRMLLVLDEQRRPLGLAPLYRRTDLGGRRRFLRSLMLLGTGEREADEVVGEYNSWLAAPEAMPLVSARLAAHLTGPRAPAWDLLRLERLRPESGIHQDLPQRLGDAVGTSAILNVASFRSPVMPLPAYLEALPSGNFRHRCRRALRAGNEAGVELVRASDAVEVGVMFEALCELHQRRWTDRGQAGVFASEVFRTFHERVVHDLHRQGQLWMVGLRRERRWLAVRYLVRAGDALYDYASGVDTETESALAPGLLLHLLTIDRAAAEGLRIYDLGAGDMDYKRKLALQQSELPTLELYARTLRAQLWLAARDMRRDLAHVHEAVSPSALSGAEQPAA
jgi:CelD/BcsL family acetyltransferase involved in cellulose biosynthesis